ncbi:MAG: hypothetical protein ACAH12_00370 [Methylophilaceae bacterium]
MVTVTVVGGKTTYSGGTGNDSISGASGSSIGLSGNPIGDAEYLGNAGNDTIFAGLGNDTLTGGNDNDHLEGGTGNDSLDGGPGADYMAGGAGNDTYLVDNNADSLFESANQGVDTIKLTTNIGLSSFSLATSFKNFENFDISALSGVDFNIEGNASANVLTGNNAANILFGLAGNDTLDGGSGNDKLDGGSGADNMNGGAGNDIYLVDNIGDVIAVDISGTADQVNTTLNYSIASRDDLEHIILFGTAINATGNSSNNILVGNSANNVLDGGDGNDDLQGGAGNDTLIGGTGADAMLGGLGNDVYIIDDQLDQANEDADEGIDTIRLVSDLGLPDGFSISLTGGLENIENIDAKGTGNVAVDLIGNARNNVLTGNDGTNEIQGDSGADTLIGGKGDDFYIVNLAQVGTDPAKATVKIEDTITELATEGFDEVIITGDFSGLQKYTTLTLGANLEGLRLDTLSSNTTKINVVGNTLNNSIFGNSIANKIDGGIGNDTLSGNAGNDSIDGGAGTDEIEGGDGDDTLTGGIGADQLSGGDGSDIYNVTLLKETSTTVVLEDTTLENEDEGDNDIIKLTGNVSLTSAALLDMTTAHFDNIEHLDIAGTGTSKLNIKGNALDNRLVGNKVANIILGNGGNDTLDGGAGNDSLEGEIGSDKLFGGTGLDTLNGGDGNDFIDGSADNDMISGGAGNDALFGGLGNDTIFGDDNNDFIDGEAGNDILNGGTGDDTIFGGAGNDTITGGDGYNKLEGEDGNDSITGGNDGNSIEGDAGNDGLTGGNGNDEVEGGIGNDTLNGMSGTDILEGGAGNDKLDGGEDNDFLEGGEGIDTLTGGAGADTFKFYSPVIAANADIITNFSGSTFSGSTGDGDKIELDAYFFNAFLDSSSVIDANIAHGTKATTTDHHLIYDALTGKLYYDADGAGGKAAVLFATLLGNKPETLSAADFELIGSMAGADPIISGANTAETWIATESIASHYSYNGLSGNDTIIGHTSISGSLSGGLGNDNITAGNSGDNLFGNEGNDTLIGGTNNDYLAGGEGNDSLSAGNGEDYLLGGIGNDKLDGGASDDYLRGDDGNDTLTGGAGEDTLSGGNGNNVMTGGDDADIFIFNRPVLATNASTISDFTSGEDILELSGDVFRKLTDGVSENNLAFGTKAMSLEHYLIYDNKTGSLYYDADGSGAGAAIKFATLSSKPASIDADDFQIV